MGEKHTEIIGGADGPTTVFFANREQKPTLTQRIRRSINKAKRHFVEKRIVPGAHSFEEVEKYLKSKYGFEEIDASDAGFIEEYEEMRTSFLFRYRPDLVEGCETDIDISASDDKEEIYSRIKEKIEKERSIAASLPKDVFDIDFHKYVKNGKDVNESMHVLIERKYGYLAGGAQGSKAFLRKWNRIYKDIYRYYGVSEDDIRNRTGRYKDLVIAISR